MWWVLRVVNLLALVLILGEQMPPSFALFGPQNWLWLYMVLNENKIIKPTSSKDICLTYTENLRLIISEGCLLIILILLLFVCFSDKDSWKLQFFNYLIQIWEEKKGRECKSMQKAYDTRDSQDVSVPSLTGPAAA